MPDQRQFDDKNENKLIGTIARFKQQHPRMARAIVYIAGIVISFAIPLILSINGVTWGWIREGSLTAGGYIFIAVCAGTLFLVQFLFDEADKALERIIDRLKWTLVDVHESRTALTSLNQSTKVICETKLHTLSSILQGCINDPEKDPPSIVSNPTQQLATLATELASRLNQLLHPQEIVHEQDLFVSILYRFPHRDGKWHWHWATAEGDLSVAELMKKRGGKCSTVRKMLDDDAPSVFENSKQAAFERGVYIKSHNKEEYTDDGKLKGSIACYRSIIKQADERLIELVVSITSYDRQFIDGMALSSRNTEKTICKNLKMSVMPNYLTRAGIELCLLYLEQLHDERSKEPLIKQE